MLSRATPFLFAFLFLLAFGCVVPPSVKDAQVIQEDEFSMISSLTRAKAYAQSGRYDQAELIFRKAILRSPELGSIYNDLGFALQGQNRFNEALENYYRALAVDPLNAQALDNIARLYYETGELEKAKEIYEALIKKLPNGTLVSVPADTSIWTKNLASVDYQLGFVDDATCLLRSMSGPQNLTISGQYVRVLLAEDRVKEAVNFLGAIVGFFNGHVAGNLMVDYGVGLYEQGNVPLAKEAFERVLSQAGTASSDRKTAYLYKLAIDTAAADTKEADYEFKLLLDDDPDLCKLEDTDTYGYWPTRATERVLTTLQTRCGSVPEDKGFSFGKLWQSLEALLPSKQPQSSN